MLLDLASGQYFGLDLVGGRIWELFGEASQSLSSLSDAIEAEFDAPRSVIETDIRALLVDLKDRELIAPQPE